ncbi:hypothetical protein CGSHi22421_00155 [Haemophilus influenzae R3021]|uniref:Uncharacterized protein n=1 Tax=Haemophilus influenzae R3021 TaxID=375432 RepID=A4N4S8_HAEIF|nr:hypothetical protein CGSHi22421_00155 [Haemophilus influenzae R3021]
MISLNLSVQVEQELMAEMALNDKDWLEFLKQLLNTTIK